MVVGAAVAAAAVSVPVAAVVAAAVSVPVAVAAADKRFSFTKMGLHELSLIHI